MWECQDLKLRNHIDFESMVGGRVRDITESIKNHYLFESNPIDIVLVCGINNVGEGQEAWEVLNEMAELRDMLKLHSIENGHQNPNRLSISTLYYPPKFTTFEVPLSRPDWLPPEHFDNKVNTIDCVNAGIKALNLSSGVSYAPLHFWGLRIKKWSGEKSHRPTSDLWKEKPIRRRLHLSKKQQIRIVMKLQSLFSNGFRPH